VHRSTAPPLHRSTAARKTASTLINQPKTSNAPQQRAADCANTASLKINENTPGKRRKAEEKRMKTMRSKVIEPTGVKRVR